MIKMVQDNYLSATNTVWDAWTESEMRAWLIEHGYMRSDAQVKRDELVELINSKCVSPPPSLPYYLSPTLSP
jgi:Putative nuclear envelope organisation protein